MSGVYEWVYNHTSTLSKSVIKQTVQKSGGRQAFDFNPKSDLQRYNLSCLCCAGLVEFLSKGRESGAELWTMLVDHYRPNHYRMVKMLNEYREQCRWNGVVDDDGMDPIEVVVEWTVKEGLPVDVF